MKNRLKRFFLSMFSDKYVEDSTEYGIGNLLITSLLAAVFLFVGVFAGRYLLFGADYSGAPQFCAFAYHAFIDENISVRIDGTGAAQVTVGGEEITVNTYASGADKVKFGMNGYGLIIDSAPSVAYDDFTPYCISKADGSEITYEAYRELPDNDKKNYNFAVRYGGTVKAVDEAQADGYRAYLETIDKAKSELAEIEESKGSVPVEDYRNSLWALYVKYYYPDMFAATGEDVPTLGGYYYGFVADSDKYICIFGDMTTVAFTTNVGKRMTVGFAYDGVGSVGTDERKSRAARENEVDAFIKDGYFGGISARVFTDFMDWVLVVVIAELAIALAIFLCWAVCRKLNIKLCYT
ncbi:MAG: hypothetical protein K2L54_05405, partial [Clostridiales bacterium]|nr:hypothetical protein [Clostridiales bacterium]